MACTLVLAAGERLRSPSTDLSHVFPSPTAVLSCAERDPAAFSMPQSRRRTICTLAGAVAAGELAIDAGVDAQQVEADLERLDGIGSWTAGYVSMRASGHPDAFLPTDLGVRRAVEALGGDGAPGRILTIAERWRPWRAYAVAHLWLFDSRRPRAQTATGEPIAAPPRHDGSARSRPRRPPRRRARSEGHP